MLGDALRARWSAGMSIEDVQSRVVADRGATAAGPLLEVADLRVDFRLAGEHVRAVDGLGYTVAAGRTLAIIGESGSGKTVSSRAVMGLLPPSASVSGSIRFEGSELLGLGDKQLREHRGSSFADGLPGPVALAEPDDAGRQAGHRGRARTPAARPRRGPRSARSSCWRSCGCRRPSGASRSTRTSSPAGCASAW
jgi:hypothetical protein